MAAASSTTAYRRKPKVSEMVTVTALRRLCPRHGCARDESMVVVGARRCVSTSIPSGASVGRLQLLSEAGLLSASLANCPRISRCQQQPWRMPSELW